MFIVLCLLKMIIVIKEKSPYHINVVLIKLIIKMTVFSNYYCPTNRLMSSLF